MAYTAVSTLVLLVASHCVRIQASGWSYDSDSSDGPENWPHHFELCGGQSQSPINIVTSDVVSLEVSRLTLNGYETKLGDDFPVVNNGHSGQHPVKLDNNIRDRSRRNVCTGTVSFHWGDTSATGSEHVVDGKSHPMEIHLVHYNKDKYDNVSHASSHVNDSTALAVLGIFVDVTTDTRRLSSELASLVNVLSKVAHEGDEDDVDSFELGKLLPCDLSMYRYNGSLTTPGCAEVVIWTVFSQPIYITEDQISKFRKLYSNTANEEDEQLTHNNRPPQALNDRIVYYYNDSSQMLCPTSFAAAAVRPPNVAATVVVASLAVSLAFLRS